jgi:hypothetical protein
MKIGTEEQLNFTEMHQKQRVFELLMEATKYVHWVKLQMVCLKLVRLSKKYVSREPKCLKKYLVVKMQHTLSYRSISRGTKCFDILV